jgi:hypothetical protein
MGNRVPGDFCTGKKKSRSIDPLSNTSLNINRLLCGDAGARSFAGQRAKAGQAISSDASFEAASVAALSWKEEKKS